MTSNKYKLLVLPAAGAMAACLMVPDVSQSNWAAIYWAVLFAALAAYCASPWELKRWNMECYKNLQHSAEVRGLKLVTPLWGGYLVDYDFMNPDGRVVPLKIKALLAIPKR